MVKQREFVILNEVKNLGAYAQFTLRVRSTEILHFVQNDRLAWFH